MTDWRLSEFFTSQELGGFSSEIFSSDIFKAVRRACLRYQYYASQDELGDLSQQILLLLIEDNCRRLYSFDRRCSFRTWLQSVANHHVSNYLQRKRQLDSLDEIDPESVSYQAPQEQDIDDLERRQALLTALSQLNEKERLLYRLYFVYELSAEKIAAIFNTGVKSIYKRKQTLIHKLKRLVS